MTDEQDHFEQAVLAWKHKHGIRDDDPMLACLELLKLFFRHAKAEGTDSNISLIEVRAAIRELSRLGKDFTKQTRELTQEMRSVPRGQAGLALSQVAAFSLTAIFFLLIGMAVGKSL